ncbi:hypothetical protein CH76_01020 [Lysinibacillus sp. BF-4]|uniref:PilX N-terminal domain-containing pilus assembly protein n=1 Tax=Lysinibacillus sp. BF-4 TaxID=1473546 RepID=UPI0005007339|nr:PilX N-terminal domain-containing pilus assembly protein [Lysinibacillus sp. BF-4]KFL44424.1 hypothetical protein CH76_01020 [Lysinibacillus sp. BF-4]
MRQFKNEQGFAMVLALLTLVLVTVIGTALIIVSSNVAKTAASERDDQAAFYIAEAAINKANLEFNEEIRKYYMKEVALLEEFIRKYNNLLSDKANNQNLLNTYKKEIELRKSPDAILKIVQNQLKSNYFKNSKQKDFIFSSEALNITATIPDVLVTLREEGKKYKFISKGINNNASRNVQQSVELAFNKSVVTIPIDDSNIVSTPTKHCYAIYAQDQISLGNTSTIGNVISGGDINIVNGGVNVKGNIYATQKITAPSGPKSVSGSIIANDISLLADGKPHISGSVLAKHSFVATKTFRIDNDIIANTAQFHESSGNLIVGRDLIVGDSYVFSPSGSIKGTAYINNLKSVSLPTDTNTKKLSDSEFQNFKNERFKETLAKTKLPICLNYQQKLPDENEIFKTPESIILPNITHEKFQVAHNGTLSIVDYRVKSFQLNVTDNYFIKSLVFSSNFDLKLNLGSKNEDKTIIIDNIEGLAKFNVSGTGNLTLIINNLDKNKGINIVKDASVGKISVVYKGTSDLIFNGSTVSTADFYIKNAKIGIQAGSTLIGDLYSYGDKLISFNGGSTSDTTHIIAPNAPISITSGAKIKGSITGKVVTTEGGAVIDGYNSDNLTDTSPIPNPPANMTLDYYLKADPIAEQ